MSIAKQMTPPAEHAFGPVEGAHRGGPDDSCLRHPHSFSFHPSDHDERLEALHSGGHHPHSSMDHGGGLGWGPAAWGEAGGFEHVLAGGLGGSLADATSAQNHVTNTTNIIFEATNGGTIDVGGNVEALANQAAALIGNGHAAQSETTNIVFDAANGGTIDVGGNVVAASTQQSQVEPHAAMDHAHFA